jgi:hypothetical protein
MALGTSHTLAAATAAAYTLRNSGQQEYTNSFTGRSLPEAPQNVCKDWCSSGCTAVIHTILTLSISYHVIFILSQVEAC